MDGGRGGGCLVDKDATESARSGADAPVVKDVLQVIPMTLDHESGTLFLGWGARNGWSAYLGQRISGRGEWRKEAPWQAARVECRGVRVGQKRIVDYSRDWRG